MDFQYSIKLLFCIIAVLLGKICCQENYRKDGAQKFCSQVPSEEQLEEYGYQCETCETFTLSLSEMRKCCDENTERVSCLDKLREKEIWLNSLYLTWKEEPEKESLYHEHFKYCRNHYKHLLALAPGEKCETTRRLNLNCLDLEKHFSEVSHHANEKDQQEAWKASIKGSALAAVCVNDFHRHNYYASSSIPYPQKFNSQSQVPFTTVHYRCFAQQALTKKYTGLIEFQKKLSEMCVSEKYGMQEVDLNLYEDYLAFRDGGMEQLWEDSMRVSIGHGVYEQPEDMARQFLKQVCNFDGRREHVYGQRCMQTPITQTYLTYKSDKTILNDIKECCIGVNAPVENDTDRHNVENCLKQKKLFQQLYPLSGLYMRSLVRGQFNKTLECQTYEMFTMGIETTFYYLYQDERARYLPFNKPMDFTDAFKTPDQTMSPLNYHFFLRLFAKEANSTDDFYQAACEACTLGEQLGAKAYALPGIMCPALVSEELYYPIRMEVKCPEKLFYKFQVAHYCCLSSAMKKFNFGPNFNPHKCAQK